MSIDRLSKRAERLAKRLEIVTEGCCSSCTPPTAPGIPWHTVPLEERIRLAELLDTAEEESVACPSCGRERSILKPSDDARVLYESIRRRFQTQDEAK